MYLHFKSFLEIESTQLNEIHPGETQLIAYPAESVPYLLMLWWLQEPGHQQAWYWPDESESFCFLVRIVHLLN